MPRPREDETEDDFVARCVPMVLDEGTARDGAQAAAMCHSMYRDRGNMRMSAMEQTQRRREQTRKKFHGSPGDPNYPHGNGGVDRDAVGGSKTAGTKTHGPITNKKFPERDYLRGRIRTPDRSIAPGDAAYIGNGYAKHQVTEEEMVNEIRSLGYGEETIKRATEAHRKGVSKYWGP